MRFTVPAVAKVMAPLYLIEVELVSGLDPSVVYQITAPAVESAMVTVLVVPRTRLPPDAGVNVGVATAPAAAKVTVTVAAVAAV